MGSSRKCNTLLSMTNTFYVLPEETTETLKVPLVDALVIVLHLGAVLPKECENALKEPMDRKMRQL